MGPPMRNCASELKAGTTLEIVSRSRDALRPRFARNFIALDSQRAQGMPDARCTRDLMRNVHKKCAHEHTGEAENIRHSLRNGFTAYNALSPVSLVLLPPQTPTSGRQDHTSLPYASVPIVRALPRPSQPRPSLVTMADAPLSGTGCNLYSLVFISDKAKYFRFVLIFSLTRFP